MSDPIVAIEALRKTYGGRRLRSRRSVEALRGVSLQAFPGEVFGLLGPNGAGKTTLIKTLLGVVRPSGGTASLFGLPVGNVLARQRIGYLPESLRIDRHHTARSALRYYGRMSLMDSASIQRRSDELLDLVGLSGRDRESVRRFSKGMYQRLGLAQALMHGPDLLILDEPTDGLDPVGRSDVRRIIQQLRDAGKTIFLNSHLLQEAELICTRVAIMSRGQLKGIGTPDELAGKGQGQTVHIEVTRSQPASAVCTNAGGGQPLPTTSDPLASDIAELHHCLESVPLEPLTIKPLGSIQSFGSPSRLQIETHANEQAQIDAVVDILRQRHFSIIDLRVHRPSLEDTFLRLVGTEETDSP